MAFMRNPLYILMQDGLVRMENQNLTIEEATWGFPVPQELFDEIVMMRYYNMTEEERRAAINRALVTQFETGADGIRKATGLAGVMGRATAGLSETLANARLR